MGPSGNEMHTSTGMSSGGGPPWRSSSGVAGSLGLLRESDTAHTPNVHGRTTSSVAGRLRNLLRGQSQATGPVCCRWLVSPDPTPPAILSAALALAHLPCRSRPAYLPGVKDFRTRLHSVPRVIFTNPTSGAYQLVN